MVATSMLVGSVRLDAFTVNVNTNPKVIAAGDYYLRHPTLALSLIDTLEAAVITEAAGAVWHLAENLKARLVPLGGQPVAIAWGSATNVRDLLGYTGDQASSDAAWEAPNQSPIWWVPGWLGTPETLLGTEGYITRDQSTQVSADGTAAQTNVYATQTHQNYRWTDTIASRMRVAEGTDGGGTWHEFHEQSFAPGHSFFYHEEQTEDSTSTSAITWDDTSDNRFGPWRVRRVDPRWYERRVPNADLYSPLTVQAMKVDEYS